MGTVGSSEWAGITRGVSVHLILGEGGVSGVLTLVLLWNRDHAGYTGTAPSGNSSICYSTEEKGREGGNEMCIHNYLQCDVHVRVTVNTCVCDF